MIKKVFLDMDEVLTNFFKGVCIAFGREYILEEITRYDPWEDWEGPRVRISDINEICNQEFWEDLEWMPNGKEILRIVEEAYGKENIFIITQPMPHKGSWTGKKTWINRMAPEYRKRLMITEIPKAVFASSDILLIDDKNENVDEFIKAGGNAILIPHPWNRLRRHQVIPHLINHLDFYKSEQYLEKKPSAMSVFKQRLSNATDEATEEAGSIREFDSGAYRDTDATKLDYEACLSPIVLTRYAQYIAKKRKVPIWKETGVRPDDNWQKGIPKDSYMKSKARHFVNTWTIHRGFPAFDEKGNKVDLEEALCADLFNTQGYLFEILKDKECPENAPQA